MKNSAGLEGALVSWTDDRSNGHEIYGLGASTWSMRPENWHPLCATRLSVVHPPAGSFMNGISQAAGIVIDRDCKRGLLNAARARRPPGQEHVSLMRLALNKKTQETTPKNILATSANGNEIGCELARTNAKFQCKNDNAHRQPKVCQPPHSKGGIDNVERSEVPAPG